MNHPAGSSKVKGIRHLRAPRYHGRKRPRKVGLEQRLLTSHGVEKGEPHRPQPCQLGVTHIKKGGEPEPFLEEPKKPEINEPQPGKCLRLQGEHVRYVVDRA